MQDLPEKGTHSSSKLLPKDQPGGKEGLRRPI